MCLSFIFFCMKALKAWGSFNTSLLTFLAWVTDQSSPGLLFEISLFLLILTYCMSMSLDNFIYTLRCGQWQHCLSFNRLTQSFIRSLSQCGRGQRNLVSNAIFLWVNKIESDGSVHDPDTRRVQRVLVLGRDTVGPIWRADRRTEEDCGWRKWSASRLALPGRTGIHDPTVAIAVVVSILALICADRYTDATPFLCSNWIRFLRHYSRANSLKRNWKE